MLITDGFPNGDMRGPPVNCELLGQPVGATGCPYEEIVDTVSAMIAAGDLDKFYVIGFALDGNAAQVAAVEALLNDIALVGDTDQAFFVADRAELVTALSTALNEQNQGATSRTAPVSTGLTPGLIQSQFISGFNASLGATDPWDGILERRRIECVAGIPVAQDVEDRDRFQTVLNAQSSAPGDVEAWGSDGGVTFTGGFSRNLWTVLPTDPADINGHLVGNGKAKLTPPRLNNDGIDVPTAGGELIDVPIGEFTKNITADYFGLVNGADDALRDTIVEWVHGVAGSGRENERLGDIYHSTPAIVGPLVDDIADRSYNDWRLGLGHQESPDSSEDLSVIANSWQLDRRPRVIYAATNDGIIHAFLADDYGAGEFTIGNKLEEFACAGNKNAGTELWGFIPPMFLDDLERHSSRPLRRACLRPGRRWRRNGSLSHRADQRLAHRSVLELSKRRQRSGGAGRHQSVQTRIPVAVHRRQSRRHLRAAHRRSDLPRRQQSDPAGQRGRRGRVQAPAIAWRDHPAGRAGCGRRESLHHRGWPGAPGGHGHGNAREHHPASGPPLLARHDYSPAGRSTRQSPLFHRLDDRLDHS
ncbi:MAG: hypothetical protein JRE73_11370 [Deltaproteobacteria bacterium]|nr:hypothetical protein [Deltaproteobacteria bacterium]